MNAANVFAMPPLAFAPPPTINPIQEQRMLQQTMMDVFENPNSVHLSRQQFLNCFRVPSLIHSRPIQEVLSVQHRQTREGLQFLFYVNRPYVASGDYHWAEYVCSDLNSPAHAFHQEGNTVHVIQDYRTTFYVYHRHMSNPPRSLTRTTDGYVFRPASDNILEYFEHLQERDQQTTRSINFAQFREHFAIPEYYDGNRVSDFDGTPGFPILGIQSNNTVRTVIYGEAPFRVYDHLNEHFTVLTTADMDCPKYAVYEEQTEEGTMVHLITNYNQAYFCAMMPTLVSHQRSVVRSDGVVFTGLA